MVVEGENCCILNVSWFAVVLFKCETCGYLYPDNVVQLPVSSLSSVDHRSFRCMGCGEMQEFSILGGKEN